METIKVEYAGVEIEYLEYENKWRMELRGRERKFDSLTVAKEAVDKPEPIHGGTVMSEPVKRFTVRPFDSADAYMEMDPQGLYVRASDYDSLAVKLESARSLLDKYAEDLANMRSELEEITWNRAGHSEMRKP